MAQNTSGQTYIEFIGSMEKGVNSGVAPNLVKNNQLFSGNNITVRGDYVGPRSVVRKLPITYQSGGDISTGLFQGACFYQPDAGNPSLIAAISGRLFQFTINGNLVSASEKTMAGDLNNAGPNQSWLWQSENYVIINDGQHNPIFFNGSTARRSLGDARTLQLYSANFAIPDIGKTVAITLNSNYTGPLNSTIFVDDALYQVIGIGGTYSVVLTNLSDTAGTTETAGTLIYSEPSVAVVLANDFFIDFYNQPYTMLVTTNNLQLGDSLLFPVSTLQGNVTGLGGAGTQGGNSGYLVTITFTTFGTRFTIPKGAQISYASNSDPNVLQGTVGTDFVVPAVGATVSVNVDRPYSGPDGAIVYVGTKQYTISAGPQVVVSNAITIQNINDVSGLPTVQNVRGPNSAADHWQGLGQLSTVPELPAGRMGCYGMGRNWMSLTDGRSFIASDIVGGSSGTAAFNNRDAPLKITENSYLFEGGVFVVPGSATGNIRAMCFAATLDASLGQGALQVFTPNTVFSCNAPVDRTTWQSLTNPILTESLISNGALGQNSTFPANGDILFRSPDGDRSLILGRREFATWGNVPQSREVQPTINADDPSLLNYSSRAIFNNRSLLTANPVASPHGVYHTILIALNFDPLSALNIKEPSVYDGLWFTFNTLQIITGVVNGVTRCFAFVLNTKVTPNVIEVWEILDDTTSLTQDNGTTPIVMDFATGDLFDAECTSGNKTQFDFCRLMDGEMFVDQVVGPVTFDVYYRPDHNPNWTLWRHWTVDGKSNFYPRMGFGSPSDVPCDVNLGRPMNAAFTFQVRFVITGSCRFMRARLKANPLPQPEFAPPICS